VLRRLFAQFQSNKAALQMGRKKQQQQAQTAISVKWRLFRAYVNSSNKPIAIWWPFHETEQLQPLGSLKKRRARFLYSHSIIV